jgi:hypothetical protein
VNGDLFDAVVAFSPGFAAPVVTHGRPPVQRCSRRLVPRLRSLGYDVTYAEFVGGHEGPEPVVRQAVQWWQRAGSGR